MSLFRGIADDMVVQDWLNKFIFPAEAKNVTADFVLWGTRLACLEMMLSGTTTFVDMYYFEDSVAKATKEAGMRGILGETMIRFKSPDFATPKDMLPIDCEVSGSIPGRSADHSRHCTARHLYQ